MKRTPILLDVDAGVDDTLTVLLALFSPRIELTAITTVAGNVEVEQCTRNVALALERSMNMCAGEDHRRKISSMVIAEGSAKPLRQRLFTAKEVHGNDGIGGASQYYPQPQFQKSELTAVECILSTVRQHPRLTIVATGPLTNIALAIQKDFRLMKTLREIVVMGGSFLGFHNTGPVAEFNFFVDPDAADVALGSGIPLRVIPLNVTERLLVTASDIRAVRNEALRVFLQRITRRYFSFHKRTENLTGGYLHDPLAVMAVISPLLLRYTKGYVVVERDGHYTRGESVFVPPLDPLKEAELPQWVKILLKKKPSVTVATSVDARRCKKLFLDTLQSIA